MLKELMKMNINFIQLPFRTTVVNNRPESRPLAAILTVSVAMGQHAFAADGGDSAADAEVVVTASRTESLREDSIVSTQVIDRDDIVRSGASTVADLFRSQAGVSTTRSFSGMTVRLQGLNPEHVLVLVDGQRVIGRKDGAIDLSRYPVDWIERVEIVKGPSSVLYGADAMGGVINLITRRADGPFSADVYGSYGAPGHWDGSGSVAVEKGKVGTRVHGGYHSFAGYDLDPSNVSTDGSAKDMFHFGAISDINLSSDWTITPRIAYSQHEINGISESESGAVYDDRNLAEEVQGALGSDMRFGSDSRLRLTGFTTWYRDQYDRDQRQSDAMDSYTDTKELLIQGSAQFDQGISDAHLLTVGVDVLAEQMDSDRLAPGTGDRKRIGIYLQDQWLLLKQNRLAIMPGFRADFDSQFGFHPTPRLAVRYDPHPSWTVRAGVGWGYRAPSFKELLMRFENPSVGYVVEGNTDLKPEKSRNVNMGVDWAASRSVNLSLSGYRNDVLDLIDFGTLEEGQAGSLTRFGYINVAEAVTQGGELNLQAELWAGFTVVSGYAFTDTLNVQDNRPLEGRPVHQVTGELIQFIEPTQTTVSARGSWNGPKTFFIDTDNDGEENRLTSKPSTLLDARIAQDVSFGRTGFRVFAGVENLLNTGEPVYHAIPPRTFFIGLTGRYPINAVSAAK